ncbi:hypothetical protein Tco_0819376 [Tanacetum coccineum]|uniref:Uncharacterized protein n=1 Tax=Tanacetum coccineum TaxID=301880 RepID=A0ABQ5A995_9ASTR
MKRTSAIRQLANDTALDSLLYGYIKYHKKTVKNGQARIRESEKYKAEARKVKPRSKSAKKSQKFSLYTKTRTNDAMTSESIQAMIDRAIQRNSTHTQDGESQSSGGGIRRPVQPARVLFLPDINKCQTLELQGN